VILAAKATDFEVSKGPVFDSGEVPMAIARNPREAVILQVFRWISRASVGWRGWGTRCLAPENRERWQLVWFRPTPHANLAAAESVAS
jgi:hypothetical protein